MFQRLVRLFVLATTAGIASASAEASLPRLSYATYVGAGPNSAVFGLAVDSAGYAYVAGSYTGCAFLTKLNQAGTEVIWSVCLPMTQVNTVALDSAGYIYVAGNNPIQPSSSAYASTVMKLSPDGQQTIYSTSVGGAYVTKLVLDRFRSAYITGFADSTFKSSRGAYLKTGQGFAEKLDDSGRLQYATNLDLVKSAGVTGDIAVDSLGQAWVVGAACPPGTVTGSTCFGTANAIRKLDANGATVLVEKTFGGGTTVGHTAFYLDAALGVAVDATDSAWIVGATETGNVPTTPGALQPKRGSTVGPPRNGVGYALKFAPSGDLLYGTFVGTNPSGDGDHTILSVAVDGQSRPYFALGAC